MKKHLIVLPIFIFASLIISTFCYFADTKDNDKVYNEAFKNKYGVFAFPMPEKLSFCNESVPVYDEEIRERMDRELLTNAYWHSNMLLIIKRCARWFPIITPILKANGVPTDFKYLAVIESSLTDVVSPVGAKGFWQFIDKTGSLYGLEINDQIDERYNLEKSTLAACKYLKDAYAEYHSWTAAAASYNMGIAGLNKQMDKQKVSNFYDLMLNSETSRYVFRVLAVKEIMENPKRYGFYYRRKDLYPPIPTYNVEVDSSITNITAFAEHFSMNYKIVKIFNPWLRQNYLKNPEHKKYLIKLPKGGYPDYMQLMKEFEVDSIFSSDSIILKNNSFE